MHVARRFWSISARFTCSCVQMSHLQRLRRDSSFIAVSLVGSLLFVQDFNVELGPRLLLPLNFYILQSEELICAFCSDRFLFAFALPFF